MAKFNRVLSAYIGCLCAAAASATAGVVSELQPAPPVRSPQPVPERPHVHVPEHPAPAIPASEPLPSIASNAGFATRAALQANTAAQPAVAPDASTLAAPVTINYAGSSVAFQVQDTGSNKGIYSNITNGNNGSSALFGQTVGSGAALSGYNNGKLGPAGKFFIQNADSPQNSVFATTSGTAAAVLGTVTNATSTSPAIWGQNIASSQSQGTGVRGDGNDIGVYGYAPTTGYGVSGYSPEGIGVFASSPGGIGLYAISTDQYGVSAYSDHSYAVVANSNEGYAVYASSVSNTGVYASSNSGMAIYATSQSTGYTTVIQAESPHGVGVFGRSGSYIGVQGNSTNGYGLLGEDAGSGYGVYGYSASGYAGYFSGMLGATTFVTLSDKNAKTNFKPIDGRELLRRIDQLPVTSWDFKTEPLKRHIGPTAQDFHEQFGLNGEDDTHINLADAAGVSMAAIKELNRQLKASNEQKDEQIVALQRQLADFELRLSSETVRMSALEARLDRPVIAQR